MPSIKKSLIAASTLFALGCTQATLAGYYVPEEAPSEQIHQWYLSVDGGASFLGDTTLSGVRTEYRTSWNTGFAFGIKYHPIRAELEYRYQPTNLERVAGVTASTSDGRFRAHTVMVNAIYDFGDDGDTYRPYIGAGIGYAHIKYPVRTADSEFAYQATFGVSFTVTDDANFTLAYRYFGTTSADRALGSRYQNHMLNAGVVYFFA